MELNAALARSTTKGTRAGRLTLAVLEMIVDSAWRIVCEQGCGGELVGSMQSVKTYHGCDVCGGVVLVEAGVRIGSER